MSKATPDERNGKWINVECKEIYPRIFTQKKEMLKKIGGQGKYSMAKNK